MLNHLAASESLQPHGLWPTRLLCSCDFPGKNIGVGCHLPQGIFLTRGSSPHLLCLLHWQAGYLPLSHLRSPIHQVTQAKTKPCQSPGIILDITCLLPVSNPIPSPIHSFPNFHQSIIVATHLYLFLLSNS